MSATKAPVLKIQREPSIGDHDHNGDDAPSPDPNSFVATLRRIGAGAAADGQPWPELHLSLGRRMQMADADCALCGLRTVAEMALAGERSRQNGAREECLDDRSMEGLLMAVLSLTILATERAQGRV